MMQETLCIVSKYPELAYNYNGIWVCRMGSMIDQMHIDVMTMKLVLALFHFLQFLSLIEPSYDVSLSRS